MRKKVIFWMLTLVMMSAASVNAQVIIGGNGTDDPHTGAGLDLSPLGAQNLGLLLPSVKLTDDAEEFVLVDGATDTQKEDATGMLVYNTDPCAPNGIGLYVWDGVKWHIIAAADYSTVTDVEGNTYSAGFFGCAGWWMTENLRSTKNDLYELTTNPSVGEVLDQKHYWYPNDDPTILDSNPEYGLIYSWTAASGRTGSDTDSDGVGVTTGTTDYQGICPKGWHLPNDYEWNQLEQVISESAANVYSATGAVTWDPNYSIGTDNIWRGEHSPKMKSITAVKGSMSATNGTSNLRTANGFDVLLVGFMTKNGVNTYGYAAQCWSSTSANSGKAWERIVNATLSTVHRYKMDKFNLLSVRCKKNE
jgi:uncharacterized protein (TIGR02145 family)